VRSGARMRDDRIHSLCAHLLFVGTCAAMVAVGLLLVVVLSQPFAGAVALDPGPFRKARSPNSGP
jgi:hypothetical protein